MFEPKVVLVTGASSGIGLATAIHLAKTGFKVYAGVRKISPLLDQKIQEFGKSLFKVILDVTDESSVQAAVSHILYNEKKIDILVNNAGYALVGTVESCTLKEQQDQFDVNVWGVVRMMQAVLPQMRDRKEGRILNIGSICGFAPLPTLEVYSASKFALAGLSESMSISLALFNIKVILLEPGSVKTLAAEKSPIATRFLGERNPYTDFLTKGDQMCKRSLASGPDPDDLAKLIHRIILTEKPHARYQFGDFSVQSAQERFTDPTGNRSVSDKIQYFRKEGLL